MKQFRNSIIVVLIIALLTPIYASASTQDTQTVSYVYFENGCYAVIRTVEIPSRATGQKSGYREKTYYSESGSALWIATLNANFTYTGTTSTCTSASTQVTIYNSAWSCASRSASRSGNTATGNFTMRLQAIFSSMDFPVTLTLSCDKNGNLS